MHILWRGLWLAKMVSVLVNYTRQKMECNHFLLTKIARLATGLPGRKNQRNGLLTFAQRISEKILHVSGTLTLSKQGGDYPLDEHQNDIH